MAGSLYNKYRPNTFSEVVGQEHVEKTLMNAVASDTVSHAYLFAGPRGTGKTTTARLLAKALLCDLAPTDQPDGNCAHCNDIAEGAHPDVYELDAASRTGVDNVREEIIGRVQFAPTQGKWKIYIIDEVHMLTNQAFNALLKTLEEPPAQVLFILCTTDAHKVPPTIQSRCQRFDFRRLAVEQIAAHLAWISNQEGYRAEDRALELIARRSQGGMRDAISSLEQVAVYSGGQITFAAVESMIGEINDDQLFALADTLARRDAAESFSWIADFALGGTDIALLVSDLARHTRNLYLAALINDSERLTEILAVTADELVRYRDQAKAFGSPERLAYILTVLGDLTFELKSAPNARLALEVACTRIIRPQGEQSFEALAARISDLEQALAAGNSLTVKSCEQRPQERKAQGQEQELQERELQEQEPQEQKLQGQELQGRELQGQPGDNLAANLATQEKAPEALPRKDGAPVRECNDIIGIWIDVIEEIKKESRSVAMRLRGSRAYLEDDAVVVCLPAGAEFARKMLESAEHLALVGTALARLSGTERKLRYVVASEPEIFASAAAGEFITGEGAAIAAPVAMADAAASAFAMEAGAASAASAARADATTGAPVATGGTTATMFAMEAGTATAASATKADGTTEESATTAGAAASSPSNKDDFAAILSASLGTSVSLEEVAGDQ